MTKQLNLRLSNEMHSALVAAAARAHRSLNGQIEFYIDHGLECQEWPAGKEVRHKDGDPRNNDPANLEVREPAAVTRVLSRLGREAGDGEAAISEEK